jgi:hypothetical protein
MGEETASEKYLINSSEHGYVAAGMDGCVCLALTCSNNNQSFCGGLLGTKRVVRLFRQYFHIERRQKTSRQADKQTEQDKTPGQDRTSTR